MGTTIKQAGPGFFIECDPSEAERIASVLQLLGVKFRRHLNAGGRNEFACNGSADRAAAALGLVVQ